MIFTTRHSKRHGSGSNKRDNREAKITAKDGTLWISGRKDTGRWFFSQFHLLFSTLVHQKRIASIGSLTKLHHFLLFVHLRIKLLQSIAESKSIFKMKKNLMK